MPLDLNAYLARIGLDGRPSLREVHRAHACAIPFENLDPQRGIPVSLVPDDVVAKLVDRRRGGYCFEQNLMLKMGLGALGYEVETLLARVRVGAPSGAIRPRSHALLRVRDSDGALWHADVGFGPGSPLEPFPFGAGGPYEIGGWWFRVVDERPGTLVLQTALAPAGPWSDVYGFSPEPVPPVDLETSNWFTCTHPRSPFVTGFVVATQRPDGARVWASDWESLALREQAPGQAEPSVTPVAREALPEVLETRFGLPGWRLGPDGRLVPHEIGRPPRILPGRRRRAHASGAAADGS